MANNRNFLRSRLRRSRYFFNLLYDESIQDVTFNSKQELTERWWLHTSATWWLTSRIFRSRLRRSWHKAWILLHILTFIWPTTEIFFAHAFGAHDIFQSALWWEYLGRHVQLKAGAYWEVVITYLGNLMALFAYFSHTPSALVTQSLNFVAYSDFHLVNNRNFLRSRLRRSRDFSICSIMRVFRTSRSTQSRRLLRGGDYIPRQLDGLHREFFARAFGARDTMLEFCCIF